MGVEAGEFKIKIKMKEAEDYRLVAVGGRRMRGSNFMGYGILDIGYRTVYSLIMTWRGTV